jgi:hypothetical protein
MTLTWSTGYRRATMLGLSGARLVWDGRTADGTRAATGIYLWRMEVRDQRREGKLVVVH